MNIRQFILGRYSTQFGFDKQHNQYFAVQNNVGKIYFSEKYRHLKLYSRGLDTRLINLAADYHINHISFADGDTVIDCGANIGELGCYFAWQGIKINYIAFEPTENEYLNLTLNVGKNNTYNHGLWSQNCDLTFYRSPENADSSFISPPSYTSKVILQAIRLDTIDLPIKIKLLKLEAEGAEPEVLDGASKILDRIEYISADVGFERGIEQLSTEQEVTDALSKYNFKICAKRAKRVVNLYKRPQS